MSIIQQAVAGSGASARFTSRSAFEGRRGTRTVEELAEESRRLYPEPEIRHVGSRELVPFWFRNGSGSRIGLRRRARHRRMAAPLASAWLDSDSRASDNALFPSESPVSSLATLQIPPGKSGAPATPQQKRFNTLIRQIEQARATLAAWNENVPLYRQAHAQVLRPIQDQLQATLRQWILRLDALLGERKWTHAEGATLRSLVCEAAGEMLAAEDDAEMKALFDKHSDTDFDTEQREMTLAMKALAEEMTGLDLGDDDEIESEEALQERMRQAFQQQDAARQAKREARDARAARKPKSKAQQRREAEEQQATQSVREIYRKLASALHPDRETDAAERAAKTDLMQRVNQAYAAGDLLALLELQLRIEQIDASHVAGASESRLKHYNKVLGEQLAELKGEIEAAEMHWMMEFGMSPLTQADPRRLSRFLDESKREWLADLARLQRELRMFEDVPATKQWLKKERRRLQEEDLDLPF